MQVPGSPPIAARGTVIPITKGMALREFADENGKTWIVWATFPSTARSDRPIGRDLSQGWLTFQAGRRRRRLVPVPRDWEAGDDARLRSWLQLAEEVSPARRVD